MKHSEFTDKFHWMNGLSEYFRYTGQEEKYEPIFKALYHNNYYRKRDILWQMIKQDGIDLTDVPDELARAWVNMLLNEHFDDIEVKPELITSFLATYSGDPFVGRICSFIDYFLFDHDTSLLLPDLGDFLSRGQVKSKLWMADELKQIVDGPLGNVVFYGGWYNFMAHFLFSEFEVDKITSLDLDENVVNPCKQLYRAEVDQGRFQAIYSNVNNVNWNDKKLSVCDFALEKKIKQGEAWFPADASYIDIGNVNLLINTSCEHMDGTWFENLPDGQFVVLQTNDYFSNPQHVNCCRDLADAKNKYPMREILYAGELDTYLYNRFMLIGIK
jgi:hypothetical protein